MKSPNDISSSDLIAIGSIGKSHGLKGSFFLNSYCDPEDNFFNYKRFFLIQEKKILEFNIKSKHIKSSKNIVNISGIETVEEIKKLTNSEIYTLNEYLKPEDGEYYWKDLIQLEVYNENNELVLHSGKWSNAFDGSFEANEWHHFSLKDTVPGDILK